MDCIRKRNKQIKLKINQNKIELPLLFPGISIKDFSIKKKVTEKILFQI